MGLLYCVERRKYQTTSAVTFSGAGNFSKISLTVKKLPSDFDIFSWSTVTNPLWTQYRANSLSVAEQDWAISFSWCGKMRSWPPPWMSKVSPRCFMDMAEHSMCHPGRPGPHGLGHAGSPGLEDFHSAKSIGLRLRSSTSTRAPACSSSSLRLESRP